MQRFIKQKGQPQAVERIFVVKKTKRGKRVIGKDNRIVQESRDKSQSPSKKWERMLDLSDAEPEQIDARSQSPSPKRQRKGKVCNLELCCFVF
jgi:hypothetical protein